MGGVMTSGTTFKTTADIQAGSGALIEAGTASIMLGVARGAEPVIYRCETLENDQFESEEFWCFAEQMDVGERVV